jgi:hypothetical protein
MKKLILIIVGLYIILDISAQEYKVKKDIVYAAGIQIGTVEGEIGLLKVTNLTFKTNEGNSIFSIKSHSYNPRCPMFDNIYCYIIRFGDTQKEFMMLDTNTRCFNARCLLNQLAKDSVISFDGKYIENQDRIIGRYNYGKKFEEDSSKIERELENISAALKSSKLYRDQSKPIVIIDEQKQEYFQDDAVIYEIVQDDVVIADVIVGRVILKSGDIEMTYIVRKKLGKSFNGEDKYYAAYYSVPSLQSGIMSTKTIYTFSDRKYHQIEYFEPKNTIRTILTWLIKNGYI